MTEKSAPEIRVDVAALRQAMADRAIARDPVTIVDISGKLERLSELSVLSSLARRKQREN
jgi:hypothetical protein